ncbi:hypothetical protein C5167_026301 [Papaver somniferum]|nr:hypothetical protein C5167_026301 [Papaver somniferum]
MKEMKKQEDMEEEEEKKKEKNGLVCIIRMSRVGNGVFIGCLAVRSNIIDWEMTPQRATFLEGLRRS